MFVLIYIVCLTIFGYNNDMKKFTSPRQKTGLKGEKIACEFLQESNFRIIECNFSCRFGEVDIIASKDGRLYFFEVKSVTHQKVSDTEKNLKGKREQFEQEYRKIINPFQNVTYKKKLRLIKTIEYYLQGKNFPKDRLFQVDGIGITFSRDENNKEQVIVNVIHNIIM